MAEVNIIHVNNIDWVLTLDNIIAQRHSENIRFDINQALETVDSEQCTEAKKSVGETVFIHSLSPTLVSCVIHNTVIVLIKAASIFDFIDLNELSNCMMIVCMGKSFNAMTWL